jgi:hypothetical protein
MPRWPKGSVREICEDYPAVDVRHLKGSIRSFQEFIQLFKPIAATDGQEIELKWDNWSVGGLQTWFRCPRCARAFYRLYFRNISWRCRKCHHLGRVHDRENPRQRNQRRLRKIEQRLLPSGATSELKRPRGMHRTTFDRLVINRKIALAMEAAFDGRDLTAVYFSGMSPAEE